MSAEKSEFSLIEPELEIPGTSQAVIFNRVLEPNEKPDRDTFKIADVPLYPLKNGQIFVETLYLSVDPAMRLQMNEKPDERQGASFKVGEPICGIATCQVLYSLNEEFKAGDYIVTDHRHFLHPFQQYAVLHSRDLPAYTKLEPNQIPINLMSATVGLLGMTGMTAYFGMRKLNPAEGDILLVTGAAGAVGNVAGQIGKIYGCKVIGMVGSKEKADFLLKDLGFDHAVIYKGKSQKELKKEISQLAPHGVNLFYDNAGGQIRNTVMSVMREGGRVLVCGSTSTYNEGGDPFKPDQESEEIIKRNGLHWQHVLITEYDNSQAYKAYSELVNWTKMGKLKNKETRYEGLSNWPKAFLGLYKGENIGKSVVVVKEATAHMDTSH